MKKYISILIISLSSLVLLYVVFPKYDFLIGTGTPYVIRCNKITGKIDYFNYFEEFEKQHLPKLIKEFPIEEKPALDLRPSNE